MLALRLDDLVVTSFETAGADDRDVPPSPIPYSPYCCTEAQSGCDTNVKAGCTDPNAGCWLPPKTADGCA